MDTVLKCNTSCNRGLSAWEGVQGRNSRATPQVNCCVGLSVSTREPPGLLPIARAGSSSVRLTHTTSAKISAIPVTRLARRPAPALADVFVSDFDIQGRLRGGEKRAIYGIPNEYLLLAAPR
jgi:hypothetical protein